MGKVDPKKCDLSFLKGSIYKDLRELGSNTYRDIKMSLTLGTSSDLVYYLKKQSKLLENIEGDEIVESLCKGMFSHVYLVTDRNGKELVIKRSHDGWLPIQLGRNIHVPIPQYIVKIFFQDYKVSPSSLERDIYDYEKIIKPYWGKGRESLESDRFKVYLNMALYLVDRFMPRLTLKEIYSKDFWEKLTDNKPHKNLKYLLDYLEEIGNSYILIPEEERYVLYDGFSKSLQTIFIQEAMQGKEEVIEGKKMAFPFELIAEGYIPKEMPKLMLEHIIRTIDTFIRQLDFKKEVQKVPDFRPLDSWKALPPTPYEIYFAETNNLVVHKDEKGKLSVVFVDTHLLLEPEGNLVYRWIEIRYWISLFSNLRFWIRKAMEFA